MTELEKTSETLKTPVDVRPAAPSRPGFFVDLGRWLLKTPTLALVVFAAPVYFFASPLFLLFAAYYPSADNATFWSSLALLPLTVLCVSVPPKLAFVALIVLWIRAWRRDAGLGAKILVAFLTLPYLAAATVRLWAPSALEIFRNLNAS
ncbi:MAG: hypothetical protein IJO40_13685 [Thermoguttaceae bacterium]|nr:hypothetical protein [Thermoguttaceae bacterium]